MKTCYAVSERRDSFAALYCRACALVFIAGPHNSTRAHELRHSQNHPNIPDLMIEEYEEMLRDRHVNQKLDERRGK